MLCSCSNEIESEERNFLFKQSSRLRVIERKREE